MNDLKSCFVCELKVEKKEMQLNPRINLPVCNSCAGSEEEKKKADELLEGLAEGFVCGCI